MATEVSNQATVNYTFSGSSTSITEASNVNVITLQDVNSLSLNKYTNDSTFSPGGTITYFVEITNTGSQYFTGVRIVDDLPNYLTYIPGTAILYINGQALSAQVAATNPLTFTLSPLAGGNSMILSYVVRVSNLIPSSVTSLTNTVNGIGYAAMGEATDSSSTTITRSSSANLTVTKTASESSVNVNEVFQYFITMTNSGLTDAEINTIVDDLPNNFVINSITLRVGSTLTTLDPSDYTLSASNTLTIPSATGPNIIIPASSSSGDGTGVITITGYISS